MAITTKYVVRIQDNDTICYFIDTQIATRRITAAKQFDTEAAAQTEIDNFNIVLQANIDALEARYLTVADVYFCIEKICKIT